MVNASSRSLSVGVVGAGIIVADVHLPTLVSMQNLSVEWITDLDLRKAKSLARAHKLPYIPLPEDLTQLPAADIILLATPYGARDPYYNALRGRSCALYVEKPFSLTVEHHRRICSWFPDHRLACGFHRRSWGPTLLVKQIIDASLFGRLCSINYGFGGPGIVVGGRYNSDIRLAGGGILFETAIHGIDALLFCTNTTSVQVSNVKMIMDGGLDLDTSAILTLKTRQGRQIDCQILVSCLQETIERLEFVFECAVLSYSLFSDGSLHVRPLNDSKEFTLSTPHKVYPLTVYQTVHEHWSHFVAGIQSQQANWTSASKSLLTTCVIERLYEMGAQSVMSRGY